MAEIFERDWNVIFFNCLDSSLSDGKFLMGVLNKAAKLAGANILNSFFHNFEPQGASALVLISESHLSIHTYPEKGKAARFSFHTCNLKMDGLKVLEYVGKKIGAEKGEYVIEDVFEGGVEIAEKKNIYFS